jgi:NADH-quinone oxidoreductase subunit A
MQQAFLPIFLFIVCTIGLAVGLLIVSSLFNPGRPSRVTRMPYESGMDPIHDTRRRFDVRFQLLAIAFLVFDVELLFLYPWAVASRPAAVERQSGVPNSRSEKSNTQAVSGRPSPASKLPAAIFPPRGIDAAVGAGWVQSRGLVFAGAMAFVILLTLGYAYDWRKGIFRWR